MNAVPMNFDLATIIGLTIVGSLSAVGFFTMCTTAIVVEGRKERRKLEIAHERRMKALELGQTLPEDRRIARSAKSPGVLLGLGAVLITLPVALLSTLVTEGAETPWMVAASVSVVAILCGTVLSFFGPKSTTPSQASTEFASGPKSSPENADAFDFARSRG